MVCGKVWGDGMDNACGLAQRVKTLEFLPIRARPHP